MGGDTGRLRQQVTDVPAKVRRVWIRYAARYLVTFKLLNNSGSFSFIAIQEAETGRLLCHTPNCDIEYADDCFHVSFFFYRSESKGDYQFTCRFRPGEAVLLEALEGAAWRVLQDTDNTSQVYERKPFKFTVETIQID